MPLNFNVTTNSLSPLYNNSSYIPPSDSDFRSAKAKSSLKPNFTAFSNDTIKRAQSVLKNFDNVEEGNADFDKKMEFTPIADHIREVRNKRTIEDNQDNVYNVSSLYHDTTSSTAPYPLNPIPQAPIGRFSSEYILNTPFANIRNAPTLINALITLAKHSECNTPISIEGPLVIMALEGNYLRHPVLNSGNTPLLIVKPNGTNHQVQGINNQGVIYLAQSKIVKIDTPASGTRCIKIKTPEEITAIVQAEKILQEAQTAISNADFRERFMNPPEDGRSPSYRITENQQKQFIVSVDRPTALALHQAEGKATTTEDGIFKVCLVGVATFISGLGIGLLYKYLRSKLTNTEDNISDASDSNNVALSLEEVEVLAQLMTATSPEPGGSQ
ncbi:hypothetical protein [Candidatus Tisiphia endosymbiont of Nemotelus uliginosus]|uniref:hypothetical protein n=1 Tax=Candidatus Tisiphia endosymbiont of Nemotelus uliginosus TaxID=3077926 RepID=UPI0035C9368F